MRIGTVAMVYKNESEGLPSQNKYRIQNRRQWVMRSLFSNEGISNCKYRISKV